MKLKRILTVCLISFWWLFLPSNSAYAEGEIIGAPTNLTIVDNATSVTLTWEAPTTEIQPERYAIMFSYSGGGYGIATGNVGDANALNTTITIEKSYLDSLLPAGEVWTFTIRSDNDTQQLYSTNSNYVNESTAPSPSPTPEPSPSPSETTTPQVSPSPTPEPTAETSSSPTPSPSSSPSGSATPSQTPTPEPSQPSSTPEPTPTSSQTPTPEPQPETPVQPEPTPPPTPSPQDTTPAVEPEPEPQPAVEPSPEIVPEPPTPIEEPSPILEPEAPIDPAPIEAEIPPVEEPLPLEPETLEPPAEEEPAPEPLPEAELPPELEPEAPEQESPSIEPLAPPVVDEPEPTPTEEEKIDNLVDDAQADGKVSDEERVEIVNALVETAAGEAISATDIIAAGIDYADLPDDQPVELENGVVLVAEVVAALELFSNPAELVTELFSDPAMVLTALSNIGADMSSEVREDAEDAVVAAVIVSGIATQASMTAAVGSAGYRRKL